MTLLPVLWLHNVCIAEKPGKPMSISKIFKVYTIYIYTLCMNQVKE